MQFDPRQFNINPFQVFIVLHNTQVGPNAILGVYATREEALQNLRANYNVYGPYNVNHQIAREQFNDIMPNGINYIERGNPVQNFPRNNENNDFNPNRNLNDFNRNFNGF